MRASIIIASHNEGELLSRTIMSCLETCSGLDVEIVVADDCSTDGSVEAARRRFADICVFRNSERRGTSPTKALGAANARGEILVFLDAHTKPEPGAIHRLVKDVEEVAGTAIMTPAVAVLNIGSWSNDLKQVGNGYSLDLLTLEPGWCALNEMRPVYDRHMVFYESPALMGAVLAISRPLYHNLCGFDPCLRSWGYEDLDLGFKCWLMGYRILHDPQAVVGHRFQTTFDNYSVPQEHVLINQLLMTYKSFTPNVWMSWVELFLQDNCDGIAEGADDRKGHIWNSFNRERVHVELERSFLQTHKIHDECWYARRFGLGWPLTAAGNDCLGSYATETPVTVGTTSVPLSGAPGQMPSPAPSRARLQPSAPPQQMPSGAPLRAPFTQPSGAPGQMPSLAPSRARLQPSAPPQQMPSGAPLRAPFTQPSGAPGQMPSPAPSRARLQPSAPPQQMPSGAPLRAPFTQPSGAPGQMPSPAPSRARLQPSAPPQQMSGPAAPRQAVVRPEEAHPSSRRRKRK